MGIIRISIMRCQNEKVNNTVFLASTLLIAACGNDDSKKDDSKT